MRYSSLNGDSPGTTAGSTWGRQTACLLDSPCTPWGTLACYDASHTAALPTAPAHRQEEVRFRRAPVGTRGAGQSPEQPLTRSSSDSRLVMRSALRFILLGWLRCLNKKWSSRAPICGEEDTRQAEERKRNNLVWCLSCRSRDSYMSLEKLHEFSLRNGQNINNKSQRLHLCPLIVGAFYDLDGKHVSDYSIYRFLSTKLDTQCLSHMHLRCFDAIAVMFHA